ncbi:hypothetical protein CC77DRAFT_1078442 [Alternaria alternata]|uniref:Uncharacterized protein n=1 Tax=Alternaria alternata TaxID=5599 RepID=A0A177D987_ALTAL|nr:hypothetical protein CC77DRAFT_1078442 [Alternaria alternata]OAG16314.1 hypothetical protein CC77DRAFT_1078442 [Alternaria alternata]
MQLPSGRGLSLIHLNHAACDSAAHRAAVTWGESDACQHREGDTQACSRRDKCRELRARRCKRTRALCVWRLDCRSTVAIHCSLHTRSSARSERTHVKGNSGPARPSHSLPPQPLPERGPLISAQSHRPIRRAHQASQTTAPRPKQTQLCSSLPSAA